MSGIQFRDSRGQYWRVNQDGLWLLCQQFIFAQMMYERAHVVPEKTSFFSIGPNISNVQIDLSDFQARKTMQAQSLCDEMARASLENGQSVFDQLVQMKDELDLNTCNLAAMKRRVSQDNARRIESHVGFFGMGAKVPPLSAMVLPQYSWSPRRSPRSERRRLRPAGPVPLPRLEEGG